MGIERTNIVVSPVERLKFGFLDSANMIISLTITMYHWGTGTLGDTKDHLSRVVDVVLRLGSWAYGNHLQLLREFFRIMGYWCVYIYIHIYTHMSIYIYTVYIE